MRWATAIRLDRLLEAREVQRADRVGDQLAIALGVERPADDARGRFDRELGDLGADLVESPRRLCGDLPARLLEPALPLLLGVVAHALLHRLARVPRLGEDLLRLAPSLAHQRAVLL